jgi:Ca-activated chloride channel homolog
MIRVLVSGTLLACVVGALAAAAQEPFVFRSAGDLVRVFVTVTDRDGRLVTTLEQKDFEVRDEGRTQPIELFDKSPQPIRLIVMLDVSGSMVGNLPLLRNASEQLFARLRPDDVVRVGTFGKDVHISPAFTRDVNELRGALPEVIERDAPTPLWRGVAEALEAFGDGDAETRRVVLVLSDGKDSGPMLGGRWSSPAEIIDRSQRDSVMVYAIGMQSRGTQRRAPGIGVDSLREALTADLPDPGLARVAIETGGGYTEIRYGQDLGAAFAHVADELHSQYLLGFTPPKRDGKVHKLDVRVGQRGLTPRARKSYVAPKE